MASSCALSMCVPACVSHPRSRAARRNVVSSGVWTTSQHTKGGRSKSRESSDDKAEAWESHNCKHCRFFCRNKLHPGVEPKDCFWNPKFKGHRPFWVCREMAVEYVPEHIFKKKDAAKRKGKKKGADSDDE